MLHAEVDGKLHRILQPVGGQARHMQSGEPVAVEPLLHTGDTLIVDIDVADQVRNFGAIGIIALVLGQEADARKPLTINFPLLLGDDVALEPDKAALGKQPLAQFGGVEIGQIGGEQFNRFIDINQPARLGVE